MDSKRDSEIAQKSSKCLHIFKKLMHTRQQPKDNDMSEDDIVDAVARFRTWVDNIGALQRGESSLDYRLRHADLRTEVLRLLDQLMFNLEDCQSKSVKISLKHS